MTKKSVSVLGICWLMQTAEFPFDHGDPEFLAVAVVGNRVWFCWSMGRWRKQRWSLGSYLSLDAAADAAQKHTDNLLGSGFSLVVEPRYFSVPTGMSDEGVRGLIRDVLGNPNL